MITKNISWSLGATPNKSLDHTPQAVAEASVPSLLFRFTFRVTLAQIDHAKTAYIPLHPPARSIESIQSIPSLLRVPIVFSYRFSSRQPRLSDAKRFFSLIPHTFNSSFLILNS
jgi:hypothetical protein